MLVTPRLLLANALCSLRICNESCNSRTYTENLTDFALLQRGKYLLFLQDFVGRIPEHTTQVLPDKIIEAVGEIAPRVLEAWVVNEDESGEDEVMEQTCKNKQTQ